MYIRRTTIKSRRSGDSYYTYRLVESIRTGHQVRQRTLLNLGRHFEVPKDQWTLFAQRIDDLIRPQEDLVPIELDSKWEGLAQRYSALVIRVKARLEQGAPPQAADYQSVDMNSLDMVRPRSVGVEHVALESLRQIGLDKKLEALGFNGPQRMAAIGTIIARMAAPGSELSSSYWLTEHSGLGELVDFDFETLNLMSFYRVSDQLLKHKEALESFLYSRERDLFEFDEVITLYDLTNTYFEGAAEANSNAAFGKSKEKRSDCPLVTLALVLDGSGFPRRSEVFPGNVTESKTLAQLIEALGKKESKSLPTVVLDAGIATEENINWLIQNGYYYIVVSRRRHLEFNEDKAVLIKEDGDSRVRAQRVVDTDTNEVRLYCHSTQREKTDRGISELSARRFESELDKLACGLHKKRTVKRYEKVLERLGRLKQKYARVAQYYDITIERDEAGDRATAIHWQRNKSIDDTLPGVYCLRTNQNKWDEDMLWRTYTMLTDLEAVFRSLKSELGLRPVFHQKTHRVSGHLFISVLAYHLVHTIRFQLKASHIHLSWLSLRRELEGQCRVTVELKRADGKTLHIRRATRPELRQQHIYDALGYSDRPGRTEKVVI